MFLITQTKVCATENTPSAPLSKRARHFFISREEATAIHSVSRPKFEGGQISYRLRGLEELCAPGSLISCPAFNSTFGPMPFNLATSSAESFREAAILAIVSPFFARTLVSAVALESVVVDRFQVAKRILLFGTKSFVADFRSAPAFID